jgi:hypothetical protein
MKQKNNICGECTACCTVLGVTELQKPMYQTCKHVCGAGCAIHQTRPAECRKYECFYYHNPIDISLRPDKIGLVIEPQDTKMGPTLVTREVWLGASDEPDGQNLLDTLMKNTGAVIYIIRPDNTRSVLLPPGKEYLAEQIRKKSS